VLALRFLLLAGVVAAVAMSAATARWHGRLTRDNHTWLMDLGTHPVWSPPPPPGYEAFRRAFAKSVEFPPPGDCVIDTAYDPAAVAVWALLFFWPVTGVCGGVYLVAPGGRRDIVLHGAAGAGVGLTLAVAGCVGLWCVAGGWGPPAPACFGVFGLLVGVIWGLKSFNRREPLATGVAPRG
jgi:hypothetical protein